MSEPQFTIEVITDPVLNTEINARHEQALKNIHWLSSHWSDLLPQARGKFIAIAGQEGFIGETDEDARRLATAAHPEDKGMFSQYVFSNPGPRFYGHFRRVETR